MRKNILRQIDDLKGRSLTELENKINVLTTEFRDKDGFINGGNFTVEVADKIKEYQKEIEDIISSDSGTCGSSQKDKIRRRKIYENYPEGGTLEERRLWWITIGEANQTFLKKLASIERNAGIDKNVFYDDLKMLFLKLNQIQSRKPTEKYEEVVNKIKGELASKMKDGEGNAIDKNHRDVEEKLKEKDEDGSYTNEWYRKNHFTELKYDIDNKTYYEKDSPIHIWTEIVPNDPAHYATAQSSLLTEVSLNGSIKNPGYKVDILEQPSLKEKNSKSYVEFTKTKPNTMIRFLSTIIEWAGKPTFFDALKLVSVPLLLASAIVHTLGVEHMYFFHAFVNKVVLIAGISLCVQSIKKSDFTNAIIFACIAYLYNPIPYLSIQYTSPWWWFLFFDVIVAGVMIRSFVKGLRRTVKNEEAA